MRVTYSILEFLKNNDARSKVKAKSRYEIQESIIRENGSKWNERTIYNKLRMALDNGYISKGLKMSNADTFYITLKGLEFMEDLKLPIDEDIEDNEDRNNEVKMPLDYEYLINSMDYARHHFESIEALLRYKNDDMMELNKERLLSSINLVMDSLQELKENI